VVSLECKVAAGMVINPAPSGISVNLSRMPRDFSWAEIGAEARITFCGTFGIKKDGGGKRLVSALARNVRVWRSFSAISEDASHVKMWIVARFSGGM